MTELKPRLKPRAMICLKITKKLKSSLKTVLVSEIQNLFHFFIQFIDVNYAIKDSYYFIAKE